MRTKNYLSYGLKFLSILLVLSVLRFILVSHNGHLFSGFSLYHYGVGFLFDLVTCALFYLPYMAVSLLPMTRFISFQDRLASGLFMLTSGLLFLLNTIDIGYVGFVKKRITADFLMYICFHSESEYSLGAFLSEFWYLLILFFLLLASLWYLEKKTKIVRDGCATWSSWMTYVGILILFVLVGRGGFTLRPIGIIESYKWVNNENAVGVLNSGFTFIKTISVFDEEPVEYMSREEEKKVFNPVRMSTPKNVLPDNTNVVFIILEGYSSCYSGPDCSESYTPFLDSILSRSMYFRNGLSNAQTSIDALPILMCSVPNFSKQSLVLSGYQFNGLPMYLRSRGYTGLFFHGAKNGSMRFDSFAKSIGFDSYFGMSEYPTKKDYDGSWGIWDHAFLPWTVQKINKVQEPFFSCIYSLSSHHPFNVPKGYRSLPAGPDKICRTIRYTDESLELFWEEAKKQDWFSRTLFVFCADHTGYSIRKNNLKIENRFRIPIAFYHPEVNLSGFSSEEPVQQLDILPTLLDLLNIEQKIYTYGNSVFSSGEKVRFNYSDGRFYLFAKASSPALHLLGEPMRTSSSKIATAMYQRFQYDLLENKMRWKY